MSSPNDETSGRTMVAVGELANPMELREGTQGVGEQWKASVHT